MVHQYKLNGYNIIIDSESGCIHTVDDVAYDIISMYENSTKDSIVSSISEKHDVTREDIEDVIADIETLVKENKLFTKDIFSGQAPDFKKRQSVVKAICLHVAHAC